MNSTLSIDISKSWLTSTVEIRATSKANHGPVPLSNQAIWADPSGNAFYIIGGHAPYFRNADKLTKDGIWKFTADGMGSGKWEKEQPSNPEMLQSINLTEKPAFVTAHGSFGSIGYVIGGQLSRASDPGLRNDSKSSAYVPKPVAISYDLQTKMLGPFDVTPILPSMTTLLDGRAIHVPQFGPDGFVFVLGGTKGVPYEHESGSLASAGNLNFNNVSFFDPKTGQWNSQATSGVAPDDRETFCMVGAAGQAGTYEM